MKGVRQRAGPTSEAAWKRELHTVRKVRAGELRQVAAVLARAFYDDPPTCWTIPDEERREEMLYRGFHFYLRKLWFPRHGFEVTEEFRFAEDAPPLWRMWRVPGQVGA